MGECFSLTGSSHVSYGPDTLGFHGHSAVLCYKHWTKRNQNVDGGNEPKLI